MTIFRFPAYPLTVFLLFLLLLHLVLADSFYGVRVSLLPVGPAVFFAQHGDGLQGGLGLPPAPIVDELSCPLG
nr:hypothetical protein [Candidatus Sigynarchaeota archaeon]